MTYGFLLSDLSSVVMEQVEKLRNDGMQRTHSNALDSQRFMVDCHNAGSLKKAKKIVDDALLKYQCVDIQLPLGMRPLAVGEQGEGIPVIENIDMQTEICGYLDALGVDYHIDEGVAGMIEIRRVKRIQPAIIKDVAHLTLEQAKFAVKETFEQNQGRNIKLLTGIAPSHSYDDVSNHISVKLREWLESEGRTVEEDDCHPGALYLKSEDKI